MKMSARWSPFIKQIAVIGLLVAGVWLLVRGRLVLTPLVLALLIAYLLSFPVGWLTRHTVLPRTMAVAVVYLLALVVIVVAPVLILPRFVSLIGALTGTLIKAVQHLADATPQPVQINPALPPIDLGVYYAPVSQWLRGLITPDANTLDRIQTFFFPFASSAAIVVRGAVAGVVWTIFVVITSFYIVKDGPRMGLWLAARLPEAIRPEVQRLWQELANIWDAFVRGQFAMGLTVGLIVWIVTWILGVRNAPALGLLSAFAEFVPGIAPPIAGAVGTLIALIFGSTWLPLPNLWFAVTVVLFYILLSQFENMYLLPRIVGRRISLHPIVVIVGAMAGAEMVGVLGILLAAPVIASLRTLLAYVVHKLLDEDPFPPLPPPPDRAVVWQSLVSERPVCAILFDLDGTLIEADDLQIERLAGALSPLRRLFPEANLVHSARRLFLAGNAVANVLVMLLELLRLNKLLCRLEGPLRRLRGIRSADAFLPVPGSVEMLRWLARHYRLGIVTSRSRAEVSQFLRQQGLTPLFHAVVTRDDVWRLKPHPLPALLAARQLNAPPEQCVMVGDTGLDVRAARAAGMLSIGVLSGFGEDGDLGDADLVLSSAAQLGAWL